MSSSIFEYTRRRLMRSAFTLVELLVVIAIISVLVGILLPSLRRARDSAMQVACLANLRSIGQAMYMYAGENKGFLPLPAEFRRDPYGGTPGGHIHDFLGDTEYYPQESAMNRVYPYLRNYGVYRCPTNEYWLIDGTQKLYFTSYGMSAFCAEYATGVRVDNWNWFAYGGTYPDLIRNANLGRIRKKTAMMLGESGRYGDAIHGVYCNETVIPWYPVDHWGAKCGMPPSYLSTLVPWNNGWSHPKGMNYIAVDGSGHFLVGFSDIMPPSPELEDVWFLK